MLPSGHQSRPPFEIYTNKTSAGTDILVTLHRSAEAEDDELPGDVGPPRPTALLLGWYGSSRRNMSKYAVLYRNFGYHTVQTSAPTSVVFSLSGSSRQPFLLSVLRVLNADQRLLAGGLVLVAFSNGGACVLPCLLDLFRIVQESPSRNAGVVGTKAESSAANGGERRLLPSPSRSPILPRLTSGAVPLEADDFPVVAAVYSSLAALMFDSSPCFLHAETGVRALVEGAGLAHRPWLVAIIRYGFLAFVRLQHFVYGARQVEFWRRMREARYPAPELYMYSAADQLLDEAALDELISYRKSEGLASEIRVWRIEDAPHVQLFRTHPGPYADKVREMNEWGVNRFRARQGLPPWPLPETSPM